MIMCFIMLKHECCSLNLSARGSQLLHNHQITFRGATVLETRFGDYATVDYRAETIGRLQTYFKLPAI